MAFEFKCSHCSHTLRYETEPAWAVMQVACPGCDRTLTVRFSSAEPDSFDALAAFAIFDGPQLEKLAAAQRPKPEVQVDDEELPNPLQRAIDRFKSMPRKRRVEAGVIAVVVLAFVLMVGGFLGMGGGLPKKKSAEERVPQMEKPVPG